jgi:hypothetical protein
MVGARARAAAVVVALGLAAAACSSLVPPQVACNGIERSTCQRIAQEIISQKTAEDPSRRVVRLEINDQRGSYTLTYDNGDGESMIVD